jgi:hypothetical protein
MYKVKLSPEEALETIKLRMKYDSSKTLNENIGIVKEQKSDEEFNEDVIGSYERKELNKIAQDTVNEQSPVKWYDVFVKWNGSGKSKVRDDQFWRYEESGDIWNFKKNGGFIYANANGKSHKGTWVVNGTDFKIQKSSDRIFISHIHCSKKINHNLHSLLRIDLFQNKFYNSLMKFVKKSKQQEGNGII